MSEDVATFASRIEQLEQLPSMTGAFRALEQRLTQLERQHRRWRVLTIGGLIAIGPLIVLGLLLAELIDPDDVSATSVDALFLNASNVRLEAHSELFSPGLSCANRDAQASLVVLDRGELTGDRAVPTLLLEDTASRASAELAIVNGEPRLELRDREGRVVFQAP